MMRYPKIAGVFALAAAATLGRADDAAAQDYRYAASYNAGAIWFSPLNPSAPSVEGTAPGDIELGLGWVIGLQAEKWFGSGRVGARLNGALTERPLTLPGRPDRDIGVWLLDADLLLRLAPATPNRMVSPFISAGVGVIRYKLGEGSLQSYPDAGAVYDGNDDPRLMGTAGLGFDILTALEWDRQPVGFRLEVVDHVAIDSPFHEIGGDRFGLVHNVRVVLGVFSGFGVLR